MSLSSFILLRFEWIIIFLIFLLLIMKLTDSDKNPGRFLKAVNILLALNFVAGLFFIPEGNLFAGFFKTNGLIVLEKNILNLGLLLISLTSSHCLRVHSYRSEFYLLLLSSVLGMFTMLSSGHTLTLYLGLEMSTIPLAALANFNKNLSDSSEAGIKLILNSAFSTGIMLFGISLLYGAVGNLSFENIMLQLKPDALTLFAFVFILAGFAFKMSVVPFHLWTADVYQGSPVAVTNFLAAMSKASVTFVFISVLYSVFGGLKEAWLLAVSVLAILSMTIGNLFALRQENLKRLLAFSSISQVGFVLVGIAGASKLGMAASIYFIVIYILSNVAAFGVIGLIFENTGKENLSDYKGLYKSNPFYAIVLAISLFSLAGIPPTTGFFGKLFLLTSGMSNGMYILLAFAAINLVLSLYNYLRVVKVMFIDEAVESMPVLVKPKTLMIGLFICVIGIILIAYINPIYDYIHMLSFGM